MTDVVKGKFTDPSGNPVWVLPYWIVRKPYPHEAGPDVKAVILMSGMFQCVREDPETVAAALWAEKSEA